MRLLIASSLFHLAILLVGTSASAQQFIAVPDSGFVSPKGVAVDANGDVYVVGWFGGTVNFNPNGSRKVLVSDGEDPFIAKYRDEKCMWAFNPGGPYQDIAYAVETCSSPCSFTA